MSNKLNSKYFKWEELQCKTYGRVVLAPNFLRRLDELREAYGAPMIVNSCCRTKAYNEHIGGNARSLHVYDQPYHKEITGTCAIDISMKDGVSRAKLIKLALEKGWSVGVADSFIHLDRRSDYIDYPQVVFTY